MAYNKITSHFSSSQTFSNTNLFIYDSNTEELKTTQFYLEDESSSNTITASNNTLIITGTIDVQNDITASDIIFDGSNIDKGIRFGETDNYIRKVDGLMSIESPLGLNLDSDISVKNSIVKGGITGSYINTHDGKLLSAGDSIVVDEETLPSGKIRWKIAQGGGSKDNCGKTTFWYHPRTQATNSNYWGMLTGSDSNRLNYSHISTSGPVYIHYKFNDIRQNDTFPTTTTILSGINPVEQARHKLIINLDKFSDEHKEYIQTGNRHIFILHTNKIVPHQSYNPNYYDITISLEMADKNQQGCKYTFIFSYNLSSSNAWKVNRSSRPLVTLKRFHDTYFTDATWHDKTLFQNNSYSYPLEMINAQTDRDINGVSFTVTKIGNKWQMIGNE